MRNLTRISTSAGPVKSASGIDVSVVDKGPPAQFVLRGQAKANSSGKTLWAGVKVGKRFWPLVELVANARDGQSFAYRVDAPSGITSGALVVVDAGPVATALFTARLTSGSEEGSLDWTHFSDVEERSRVEWR